MTSNQPYLLKAFYDWIVDNELTPHLVVDATAEHVQVPLQYVNDGQIVLNVSPGACMHLLITPEGVSFQARFGGKPHQLSMPTRAVLAIYARENGAGTVFTPADPSVEDAQDVLFDSDEDMSDIAESVLDDVIRDAGKDNGAAHQSKAPKFGLIEGSSGQGPDSPATDDKATVSSRDNKKAPSKKPTFTIVK